MLHLLSQAAPLGYLILFGLVAAESTGVPVPGETALITAAILGRRGGFEITAVIATAAVAAIIGDNVGYLIGRKGGRRLLEAEGPLHKHRLKLLERGEPFFERHGPKAVFLGRWVTGLRIAAAWLAGSTRMRWPLFLFWNALGGIAWAVSIGLLAYFVGPAVERFIKLFGVAGLAVAVLAALGVFAWKRRRRHASGAAR